MLALPIANADAGLRWGPRNIGRLCKGKPSDGFFKNLLLALRADVKYHSFALEVGYIIRFAVLGEVGSEAREEEFTLFLEDDGTSAEEDIGFDFIALFEELDGMLELEVVIMIIGLGTETDLFDFLLFGICFCLFLFFLLSVEEFLIVHYPAYGRIRRSPIRRT